MNSATATASPDPARRWKRRCLLLAIAWLVSIVLLSSQPVRALLMQPLYLHDPEARGDVAYVMADGEASWERLRCASDLYHMNHVARIAVLGEQSRSGYNFVKHRSETRVERVIDFLIYKGVPEDRILVVPESNATSFGSLNEARSAAEHYPEVKRWVVISSAPHMRRSWLSFRRSLPDSVEVHPFGATVPFASAEVYSPIWVEYAKLACYWFVA